MGKFHQCLTELSVRYIVGYYSLTFLLPLNSIHFRFQFVPKVAVSQCLTRSVATYLNSTLYQQDKLFSRLTCLSRNHLVGSTRLNGFARIARDMPAANWEIKKTNKKTSLFIIHQSFETSTPLGPGNSRAFNFSVCNTLVNALCREI